MSMSNDNIEARTERAALTIIHVRINNILSRIARLTGLQHLRKFPFGSSICAVYKLMTWRAVD